MESPPPSVVGDDEVDSSKPLRGIVVCCTSIPPDQRTLIASRTADLGGIHKYDLTPDVTHLIVGEHDTQKYRHVARERPDVKPMSAGWIHAMNDLWTQARDIDFAALEDEWKLRPLESSGAQVSSQIGQETRRGRLLCCITGFEDNDIRVQIQELIETNGGKYMGDLSRRVTHLIVNKPQGQKYAAAKAWGINIVTIEWLRDSIERGMILDENCYDPNLPQEQRGRGAWIRREVGRVSQGKRLRDGASTGPEFQKRKLRKTASLKLNNQSDSLWGDILVNQSTDPAKSRPQERHFSVADAEMEASMTSAPKQVPKQAPAEDEASQVVGPVFSSCLFFVHGFTGPKHQVICEHLTSHGGQVCQSIEDVASLSVPELPELRFLVVPQTSQPKTHPQLPEGVIIITEFYIERCIHSRQRSSPDHHVLGRPFPQFPIAGFERLTVCTSGFRNEQLNQVEKSVKQLGARYSERLNAQASVLVCPSPESVWKQKLEFALRLRVPVVDAEWLWQCITTGFFVPWDEFLIKGLENQSTGGLDGTTDKTKENEKQKLQRSKSEPAPRRAKPTWDRQAPSSQAGLDRTAFDADEPSACASRDANLGRHDTNDSHYHTAPTHHSISPDPDLVSRPLSEASLNALNNTKAPYRSRKSQAARSRKPLRCLSAGGTVGDSEAGGDSLTTTSSPRQKSAPAAEEVEAERERGHEKQKTAERQDFAKRLASLIGHGSVAVGATAPDPTGLEGGVRTAQRAGATSSRSAPSRRNREVLGRAVSNVSAASSGSGEPALVATSVLDTQSASASERTATNGRGDTSYLLHSTAPDEQAPPQTQLGYEDPESRRHREAVLDRLRGQFAEEPQGRGQGKGILDLAKPDGGDVPSADAAGPNEGPPGWAGKKRGQLVDPRDVAEAGETRPARPNTRRRKRGF